MIAVMQFERWSLLIVGEALVRGTTRLHDFRTYLGIAPDILRARLGTLVRAGIFDAVADPPGEDIYVLTAKGRELEPAVQELDSWSRRWDPLAAPIDSERAPSAPPMIASGDPKQIEISLLGTFALHVGGSPVDDMSAGSQRLLVFLALNHRAIARIVLAGTMWPDVSDERAGISLRSALARLDATTREAVDYGGTGALGLAERVTVDLRQAEALAHRLLDPETAQLEPDLNSASIALLSQELLPDWYDDWILAEAEDWRHLRMSALEALTEHLLDAGRLGEAVFAARAVMRIDPLRESPHAMLIRVHLADGNQSEALGVFERYRTILRAALELEPTAHLSELVTSIRR